MCRHCSWLSRSGLRLGPVVFVPLCPSWWLLGCFQVFAIVEDAGMSFLAQVSGVWTVVPREGILSLARFVTLSSGSCLFAGCLPVSL